MTGAPIPRRRRRGGDGGAHRVGRGRRHRGDPALGEPRRPRPRRGRGRRGRRRGVPGRHRPHRRAPRRAGAIGVREGPVYRRPLVGVLSTGDELVDDGSPLAPGQIRDSNRHTLLALVRDAACEPVDLGLVRDDKDDLHAAFTAGLQRCDAIVTTGGVSVGDFDYVKVVLDAIGDMRWMQVAIKPAKPLAFGTVDGKPVFGLPGNPVSSMVSFELFARPAPAPDDGRPQRPCGRPCGRGRRGPPPQARRQDPLRPGGGRAAATTAALHVRSSGGQGIATCCGRWRWPTPWPCCPTATGVAARRRGRRPVVVLGCGDDPARRPARPRGARPARSRSPTAATSGAPTACRRRGCSGCPGHELLTFEEIERVARVCVERFGFDGIRLTGGEPTVRAHLPVLVEQAGRARRRPGHDHQRRHPAPAGRRPRARGAAPDQHLAATRCGASGSWR